MKLTLAIPALAAMLAATGCTTLLSTNPIATEAQAIVDPLLAGVYTNDDDTLLVRHNGKSYQITYLDKGKDAIKFAGRLFKAGDALLLDLCRDDDDPFVLNLHFVARVWPEPGMLRWALLDGDWLKEQSEQLLPTMKDGDRTLITAPGVVVAELFQKAGADERAHNKPEVWTRAQQ